MARAALLLFVLLVFVLLGPAAAQGQEWYVNAEASGCHQVAVRGELGFDDIQGTAFDPATGVIYGVDVETDQLVTIDPVTGAATAVGPTGYTYTTSLAFDSSTGTLYGYDSVSDVLVTIDLDTGDATSVGPAGGASTPGMYGLAYDPGSDTLYGLSAGLWTLDRTTGIASYIGPTTFGFFLQGLAFDPVTDTLYAAGAGGIWTLDTATGASTLLGELTFPQLSGLTFDPETGSLFAVDKQRDVLMSFLPGSGSHGNGSMATPFCKIQIAIDAASEGDLILVGPGEYFEFIDFLGKAITVRSDADVDPRTYDPDPEATIIDGNEAGGVVRFVSGEGRASVLEGFTIRNGVGSIFGGFGGISVTDSSPTIVNNAITHNFAPTGAGVRCEGGSPRVARNTITNNSAHEFGAAAVSCRGSSAEITGNVIVGNTGTTVVALREISSTTNFSGNFVADNDSVGATTGGTCQVIGSSNVVGNKFVGNRAVQAGAIQISGDGALIANNLIVDNTASTTAGGIQCSASSTPLIVNNTIAYNEADTLAGGIHVLGNSTATILNNVVWGNTATNSPQISGVMPVVEYCIVEGGWPGAGNSSSDPLFVDPSNGKYRVLPGSPCIDAGDNSAVPAMIFRDIRGAPRILDQPNVIDTGVGGPPTVDIGPFEWFVRPPLDAAGVPLTVAPPRVLR